MKIKLTLLTIIVILISCNESKKQTKEDKYLKKSYKEQKRNATLSEHSEDFDSLTNIYSNYKYHISIDAPDNWKIDHGTSKHSIFRGNDPELALTFSIVVVELKTHQKYTKNAWEFYLDDKAKLDAQLKNTVKTQFNSEIENHKATKSYIQNFVSVNKSCDFLVRSADMEYVNHVIDHQVFRDDYIYTLTAQMPKVVYDEQPQYFERLFNLVSFLPNPEKINE